MVQFTPPALDSIGYRTYIIFAILNAAWVPVVYLFFPETKGLELETVDSIFTGDNPVALSAEVARGRIVRVGDIETFREQVTR